MRPVSDETAPRVFAALAGLFLFLTIIKFGDPVLLQNALEPPSDFIEVVFQSWQVKWGYLLLAPLLVAGLFAFRWRKVSWLVALPAVWLGWQFIAATTTVSPNLTKMTLEHFSACVVLFYLGCFALGPNKNPWPVWAGIALALCWVIHVGFDQHFGGLEATRRMMIYQPLNLPPGGLTDAYLRRVASNRIFATFSNPDALAGGLELLLPVSLVFLWQITPKVRPLARWAFVAILGGCGLAGMYWTESKAGWLVTGLMGVLVLWHSALPPRSKRILIAAVFVIGIVAFAVRHTANSKKDEVSVGTRITYWKAAVNIAASHPVLGTGPGTFSVPYSAIKRPEDDFARLCHNDYLEQACDSGLFGCFAYTLMIFGSLFCVYRYRIAKNPQISSTVFGAWLGAFGLCLHCAVDYHLYTPGMAWPLFFILGFLMNFYN